MTVITDALLSFEWDFSKYSTSRALLQRADEDQLQIQELFYKEQITIKRKIISTNMPYQSWDSTSDQFHQELIMEILWKFSSFNFASNY